MADVAELGIVVELKNGQLVTRQLDELGHSAHKAAEGGERVEKMAEGLNQTLEVLGLTLGALEMIKLANEARELGERYEAAGLIARQLAEVHGVLASSIDEAEVAMREHNVTAFQARENTVALLRANIDLSNATKLAEAAQNISVVTTKSETEAMHQLIIAVQTGMARTLKRAGVETDLAKAVSRTAAEMGVSVDQMSQQSIEQIRLNAVLEATTRIQGTYAAAMKTSYGEMILAKKSIQDIGLSIGLAFSNTSRSIITAMAGALKSFADAARAHPDLLRDIAAGLIAVVGAVTTFLVIWGSMTLAMKAWEATEIIRAFISLASAIRNTADAMALLELLTEAAKENWVAITASLIAVTAGIIAYRKLIQQGKEEDAASANGKPTVDPGIISSEEALKRLAQLRREVPALVTDLDRSTTAYTENAAGITTMAGEAAEKQGKLNAEIRKGTEGLVGEASAEMRHLLILKEDAEWRLEQAKRVREVTRATQDHTDEMAFAVTQTMAMGDAIAKNAIDFEFQQKMIEASRLSLAGFTEAAKTMREEAFQQKLLANDAISFEKMFAPIKALLQALDDGISNFAKSLLERPRDAWKTLLDDMKAMFADFIASLARMQFEKKILPKLAGMVGIDTVGGNSPNPTLGAGAAMTGLASLGVGYGIGSLTANKGYGALGGATGGALTGAAIGTAIFPVIGTALGAVIGGLAGLAGGLLGSSKAAKEAADKERELREQYAVNVAQIKLLLGIQTPLQNALIQSAKQFADLEANIQAAYAGKKNEDEREKLLQELRTLEAQRNAQLREEATYLSNVRDEELTVRALRATGHAEEADSMAFAMAQEKEYRDAKAAGATAAQLATLKTVQLVEAQQREAALAEERKRALEDLNLRLAEALGLTTEEAAERRAALAAQREYIDAVNAGRSALYLATLAQTQHAEAVARAIERVKTTIAGLTQTITGLETFRDTLALDKTVSPEERLAEARRQYNVVVSAALGGSQDAASRLPQVAQTLLDVARQFDASGPGFADTFKKVQDDTAAIIAVFAAQKTAAEKQLEELQKIRAEIQNQTDIMRLPPPDSLPRRRFPGIGSASANFGPADIEGESESSAILRAGFTELIASVDDLGRKLDESITVQRTGFEGNAIS